MRAKIFFLFLALPLFANNLTIYNSNLSLVEERLDFNVTKGINRIYYKNLSDAIIPNSIFAKFSDNIDILSKSYRAKDNIDKLILEKNLNSNVKFYKNRETFSGKLISISPIVVNSNGLYYTIDKLSNLILPSYPKISNSYIQWEISAKKDANESAKIVYLTQDLSWSTNYIIDLNKDKLLLRSYANIKNSNFKSYDNFKISLLAGDINREKQHLIYKSVRKVNSLALSPPMTELSNSKAKSFEGYYRYDLNRTFSIKKGELKEIPLINSAYVEYKKYALAYSSNFQNYGKGKLNFQQIFEFKNTLNIPLPKGLVRVYKDNKLLGENFLQNTPKSNRVTLKVGTLFNITGEKIVTNYINRDKYKFVETKYLIKNRAKKEYIVKIKENIPRYGKKIKLSNNCKNSCKVKKVSAFENIYTITLKPNSNFDFKSSFEIFK